MARDRHQQNHGVRRFKGETVFDWETEPSPERPSELVEPTQYGSLLAPPSRSPYAALEVRRPRPPQKRGGSGNAWLTMVLVVVMAAGTLVAAMQLRLWPFAG